MFKAFNGMLTHLFNGFGFIFSSFSHVTETGDIYAEELKLTARLESGVTVRQLQRQITALEAQAVIPA